MGIKLPVFSMCCYCIPLRVGVKIIGYWFTLLKFLQMCHTVRLMVVINQNKNVPRVVMFYTLMVIVMLVYLVLCVTFLVGVYKEKLEYLRHFFIWTLVLLVTEVVTVSVVVVWFKQWQNAVSYPFIVINFYLLLVVRSTYLMMEELEHPGTNRNKSCENVCWDTMQLTYAV